VIDLDSSSESMIGHHSASEWTLDNAIISWDLVNFIINDLTYSAMKEWLGQSIFPLSRENEQIDKLTPRQPLKITTMVESPLETSKRFILHRYMSPGTF
jgi:hypothetical protein